MGRNPFKSEAELARVVIRWLTDQHWEIFQEVQVKPAAREPILSRDKANSFGLSSAS